MPDARTRTTTFPPSSSFGTHTASENEFRWLVISISDEFRCVSSDTFQRNDKNSTEERTLSHILIAERRRKRKNCAKATNPECFIIKTVNSRLLWTNCDFCQLDIDHRCHLRQLVVCQEATKKYQRSFNYLLWNHKVTIREFNTSSYCKEIIIIIRNPLNTNFWGFSTSILSHLTWSESYKLTRNCNPSSVRREEPNHRMLLMDLKSF